MATPNVSKITPKYTCEHETNDRPINKAAGKNKPKINLKNFINQTDP